MGVNTFLSSKGSPTTIPGEVIRSTVEEKKQQIDTVEHVRGAYSDKRDEHLNRLSRAAIENSNMFEELMEACKYCTLGDITESLFDVGGQYRRNM